MKINKKKSIKLQLNQLNFNVPNDTMGIDIGQSLTKLAHVESENELNLILLSTEKEQDDLMDILDPIKLKFKNFNFTGGRAFNVFNEYSKESNANLLDEFHSNAKGIEILYNLYKKKKLPKSLIINIGTGTSILLKNQNIVHLGGSALGGGFFMGLIKVLFNLSDFKNALKLAEKGSRYNVDLKVSDIYDKNDHRVDRIFKEYTAASFGKILSDSKPKEIKKEDFLNALICLIGENIGTIANLFAKDNEVSNLVFCGGFLIENIILKRILSTVTKLHHHNPIFLKNSEYCGAIGALLS
ncbi:MAG: hypothetical protein EU539_11530 [Promethearchaeota archaeon]|nr:MAG: hypothetical protein EU539_11530 [Candidatus Lokiarchaeota archaeon]